MMNATLIEIEVAFADTQHQEVIGLKVPIDCSVADSIRRSGFLSRWLQLDLTKHKVGIFGKVVSLDTVLQQGDRVEIYQPLLVDPKQARRRRAVINAPTAKG